MHFDIAKKWVKALRGMNYAQGAYNLYHEPSNSYCCLGVLCDLYQKEFAEQPNKQLSTSILEDVGIAYYNNECELLPQEVAEWAGMQTRSGHSSRRNWNNEQFCKLDLSQMNDGSDGHRDRKSFREIADYIEDNYMYL